MIELAKLIRLFSPTVEIPALFGFGQARKNFPPPDLQIGQRHVNLVRQEHVLNRELSAFAVDGMMPGGGEIESHAETFHIAGGSLDSLILSQGLSWPPTALPQERAAWARFQEIQLREER
jgi:hypothetical protein